MDKVNWIFSCREEDLHNYTTLSLQGEVEDKEECTLPLVTQLLQRWMLACLPLDPAMIESVLTKISVPLIKAAGKCFHLCC